MSEKSIIRGEQLLRGGDTLENVEGSGHVGFRGLAVCFAISERSMLELSGVAGYDTLRLSLGFCQIAF